MQLFNNLNSTDDIKVYSFVGPSGTGKSYRAQMVAKENNVKYIIMTRRSKITNQQIIQDFNLIHGNKYDYSLVEYSTMHNKVKIICPIHGEFQQTPNAHMRQKQGCKKCALILKANNFLSIELKVLSSLKSSL